MRKPSRTSLACLLPVACVTAAVTVWMFGPTISEALGCVIDLRAQRSLDVPELTNNLMMQMRSILEIDREHLDAWDREIRRLNNFGASKWLQRAGDGRREVFQRSRYRPPCFARLEQMLLDAMKSEVPLAPSLRIGPLGERIATRKFSLFEHLTTCDFEYRAIYRPDRFECQPYSDFVLEWATRRGLLGAIPGTPEPLEGEADVDDELLADLRVEFEKAALSDEVAARMEDAESRFERGVRYLNSIREKHPHLLLVQLDVGFCSDIAASVSVDEAKRYLLDFLNKGRSRRNIFGHRIGYFWKLEPWDEEQHYFSMILIFDGEKEKRDHLELIRLVGEYWCDTTLDGKGAFSNYELMGSSLKPNPFKLNLGRIGPTDAVQFQHLLRMLRFFTQTDLWLKTKTGPRASTFGHGEISRSATGGAGKVNRQQ